MDLKAVRVVGSVGTGARPDVLAFDPGLRRLYVAAESGTLAVFDASQRRLRRLGLAKLADNAHSVAVDPATHRVLFPLQGQHPVLRVMAAAG